jgi:hypothetical protein
MKNRKLFDFDIPFLRYEYFHALKYVEYFLHYFRNTLAKCLTFPKRIFIILLSISEHNSGEERARKSEQGSS